VKKGDWTGTNCLFVRTADETEQITRNSKVLYCLDIWL
jgi:hypothetical protein